MKSASCGSDSLLYFSVCSELLASQLLPNGTEWTDATGSCKPYVWLITTIWTSLLTAAISHNWFPYPYIPWDAPDREVIYERRRCEANCHLLAAGTGHRHVLCRYNKPRWRIATNVNTSMANLWVLAYAICYPYAVFIYTPEQSSRHQNIRYLYNYTPS
jgi:hypothetical protein